MLSSAVIHPQEFSIIGSDDCKNWDTMLHISEAGFSKPNEFKSWDIPAENRRSYVCVGLKIVSTKSGYVGLKNVVMWTEKWDLSRELNGVTIL